MTRVSVPLIIERRPGPGWFLGRFDPPARIIIKSRLKPEVEAAVLAHERRHYEQYLKEPVAYRAANSLPVFAVALLAGAGGAFAGFPVLLAAPGLLLLKTTYYEWSAARGTTGFARFASKAAPAWGLLAWLALRP